MSTAKQLISAFVDAPPLYWDRSYVQNMREIRGYPNWWRIRDDVAYIDGPPNEGEQYTRDLYVWSVEIVKDEDTGENTNKLELYDLDNTLEETTEVVNGETVYRWKYREQEPELTYEHTDVIDSVSLEFDQLGRRLIAFESAGDVFLIWYDPLPGTMVVTNWGAGYTPQIVTDTYRRTGGSADSERLLFYVDNTTKQIVYRRQNDRYQTAYALPSAPSDVVEILKVSKNIYGGLTVLYCYDDGLGNLETGSFTASVGPNTHGIGADDNIVDNFILSTEGSLPYFSLKKAAVRTFDTSKSELYESSGAVLLFELKDSRINLSGGVSTSSFQSNSADVLQFSLDVERVPVSFTAEPSSSALSQDDAQITSFELRVARTPVFLDGGEDSVQFSQQSGTVTNFSLG